MHRFYSNGERPVLLLGATGQLGTELARAFRGPNLQALDRHAADFAHPESLRDLVRAVRPALILNAVAYTAVDRAESEPAMADIVNHQSPRVLAEEAERLGSLVIHYSTDYVFDGKKSEPWIETDPAGPLNVYGATKLAGEQAVAKACQHHLILRTSWVYGPHGSNFLRTMLRLGLERPVLKVVNDQWGAPTSSVALADATRAIVDKLNEAALPEQDEDASPEHWAGIYHLTCAGKTTWCAFAEAIFGAAAERGFYSRPQVCGISAELYPTAARRPLNSMLSNQKVHRSFGVQMPHWEMALETVFRELEQNGLPL
jgi:dTDP-4-dehydrorhamnose reductase